MMSHGLRGDRPVTDARDEGEPDFRRISQMLIDAKWWIIGPALCASVLTFAAVNLVKPRFTGEAKVLIENQESYFTRPEKSEHESTQLPDAEAVASQVQLVSSRDLVRQAIKALKLQGNPQFDPLAEGLALVSRGLVALGLARDPMKSPPEERILDSYFDRITVFP